MTYLIIYAALAALFFLLEVLAIYAAKGIEELEMGKDSRKGLVKAAFGLAVVWPISLTIFVVSCIISR